MLRKVWLALALALCWTVSAFAQNAPSAGSVLVTPSYFSSVPMFWVGQANGATACNTGAETAAQDTITIPAPNVGSNYLSLLTFQLSMNATGATQVGTISFTGIPTLGATPPFLSEATVLTTTQGLLATAAIPFVPPLKGLAGTAITVVPSAAQNANVYLCMTAEGYQSL